MKKRILKFLLLNLLFIFFSFSTFSNDWEFGSKGEHIVPLKSSEVKIKKEKIEMKMLEDGMLVNVKFTFDSSIAETKVIGFITPEDMGSEYEEDNYIEKDLKKFQIKDFNTKINGKVVKSNVDFLRNILSKGILEKNEIKKYEGQEYKNSYIYYFNADFVKGLNTVEHSYFYTGSYGIGERDFEYVLTTISKWKDKKVGDFELTIDIGNYFVVLPYTFWENNKKIDWEVVGEGRILSYDKIVDKTLEKEKVFAKMKNGYIRFKANNFSPDYEFYTVRMDDLFFSSYAFPEGKVEGYKFKDELFEIPFYYMNMPDDELKAELKKLSDKELEIVRNYPYAIQGYDFSKKDLKEYFSQFFWYIPVEKDENINVDKIYGNLIKTVDEIKKEKNKN